MRLILSILLFLLPWHSKSVSYEAIVIRRSDCRDNTRPNVYGTRTGDYFPLHSTKHSLLFNIGSEMLIFSAPSDNQIKSSLLRFTRPQGNKKTSLMARYFHTSVFLYESARCVYLNLLIENSPISKDAAPRVARSERISPTTLANLKPCPEKPPAISTLE
ncbi:hypothetical protein D3C81_1011330 [compost metagenome]